MALRVMGMAEIRLEVLLEPERTGDSVAEVCRRHGITRETFYVYRRRWLVEGAAGLEPRSTRPPALTPTDRSGTGARDLPPAQRSPPVGGPADPPRAPPGGAPTRRRSPRCTRLCAGTTWWPRVPPGPALHPPV